mmetsp:Transcript_2345/g.4309  ORF Transcript_2345/g.4309 Transcript_2345/m.4309 type:complete len:210 (-) Transcript_2345:913-1542(-)
MLLLLLLLRRRRRRKCEWPTSRTLCPFSPTLSPRRRSSPLRRPRPHAHSLPRRSGRGVTPATAQNHRPGARHSTIMAVSRPNRKAKQKRVVAHIYIRASLTTFFLRIGSSCRSMCPEILAECQPELNKRAGYTSEARGSRIPALPKDQAESSPSRRSSSSIKIAAGSRQGTAVRGLVLLESNTSTRPVCTTSFRSMMATMMDISAGGTF